jgi:RNA polymerase sigma factor (sigma-70 family)
VTSSDNRLPDQIIIQKILAGDEHASRILIRLTERLVTQIIFQMIRNPEDHKDLAQDIYLKAFARLGSFRQESKLSTWIAQITYNACIDYQRKKRLTVDFHDLSMLNDDQVHLTHAMPTSSIDLRSSDLKRILESEINKLNPIFKTLIILYHNEELRYEEIATITSLPLGTVKSYLSRARKILKDNLLENYNKEDL